MGRDCIWASGILAAVILVAGPSKPALASQESPVEASATLRTLVLSPGFDLVPTSEMPPELVDYTIASLMTLATPWPIEKMPAETPAKAESSASVTPAPIDKPKTKTKPQPKVQAQKPQQKSSAATAAWWRRLFWVRIR
jgi:outer membrane biosynthesis protein TonB